MIWVLGYKTTEMKYHFHHVTWHLLSMLPITCDTDLDHLSKVVFVRFIHCFSHSHASFFFFYVVAFVYLLSSLYFQLFWILFYTYCDTHIVGFLLPNLMHSISPFFSFPLVDHHLDWNGFSSHTKFSPVLVTKFYVLLSF